MCFGHNVFCFFVCGEEEEVVLLYNSGLVLSALL